MTGLMEKHEAEFEILTSETETSSGGHGYIKCKCRIITGPHVGVEIFFYYIPNRGYYRQTAERFGLAITQETLAENIGKRFIGRVIIITRGSTASNTLQIISPRPQSRWWCRECGGSFEYNRMSNPQFCPYCRSSNLRTASNIVSTVVKHFTR